MTRVVGLRGLREIRDRGASALWSASTPGRALVSRCENVPACKD